ncbi:MAG: orotidine-5'-phosphate decarboxylase [Puniceicoccales bacterium]|jgi:orotidine-5'-phosphate decarboxylase|nr:orotidine-5'-phosphate decarboxylase [Puniceicoccales bacterium]
MAEIILALDVESLEVARTLVRPLRGRLRWVKVGLQLFAKHGPEAVDAFADLGFDVFLDLKLHDIPNTVASAIRGLRGRRCRLLTVHTAGGPAMLSAAVEASREALPEATILGVTVLTSMDAGQLAAAGVPREPHEQVSLLARMASHAGVQGFVCSPQELRLLRTELGPAPILVTPGIRAADAPPDDQSRTLTPAQAVASGATHLVVGRPILKAADPAAALLKMQVELGAPAL